jgi:hypothetical protein
MARCHECNAKDWRRVSSIIGGLIVIGSLGRADFVIRTADAQENYGSLFGVEIGSVLSSSKDFVFVEEDETGLRYIFRHTTNHEYLLQGLKISKKSHRVVSIDGRTATGQYGACHRMLSETSTQLIARYPTLKMRVDDVDGTSWHLLSMERPACFTNETVGSTFLRIPCTASFLLHCERQSNAFVIEASDTELSKLARDEAATTARAPARNHLD